MNESCVGVSTTPDWKRKLSGSSGARGKLWEEAGGKRLFFPFDPFHDTPCAVMHSIQSSLSPKYVNSDWVLVFGNPRKVLFEVTE